MRVKEERARIAAELHVLSREAPKSSSERHDALGIVEWAHVANEARHGFDASVGKMGRFIVEHAAWAVEQGHAKTAAIEPPASIKRVFLRSAELELRDDVNDRDHARR